MVHRCIKGSLALSSLVMLETFVHRLFKLYEANVDRFVVPSRFVLDKLVEWGWPRERFVHIPNFVDIRRFARFNGRYCVPVDNGAGLYWFTSATGTSWSGVTITTERWERVKSR